VHVRRDSRWFAGGIDRTRRVWSEPVRHSNDAGSSTTAVAATTIADHGRDSRHESRRRFRLPDRRPRWDRVV